MTAGTGQLLKRIIAGFPERWQTELKRIHFSRQIRNGTFATDEIEYGMLHQFVAPGDWVLDIGANIGQYTRRLSELVGRKGRVIAFEPVPTTFSLLAANVERFEIPNVTLINAAVSDHLDVVGMEMPKFSTGLNNYYQAHLAPGGESGLQVLTLSVDALGIDRRIGFVKIDAEGHEAHVLAGMDALIREHRPVLVVETGSEDVINGLVAHGYRHERFGGSSNVVFHPEEPAASLSK